MKTHSPLVGMHFRPPAKAILGCLPQGAELRLLREPGNEFDPNAIQVWCKSTAIPESQLPDLDLQSTGFGFSAKDIMGQEEWWLGFIASKPPKGAAQGNKYAPELAPKMDQQESIPKARLVFDGAGKPLVEIDW